MSLYAEIPIVVLAPSTGDPVSGASVAITRRSDGVTATVYTTEGATTQAAQPLVTDSQGRVQGWMSRGQYNAEISGGGIPTYTEAFDIAVGGDGSVDANWLASNAVTTAKVADAAVTMPKLAGYGAVVSTLPASPIDGQICFFQDSGMATAGVVWQLRYRSGASGSYKWEFIGGMPLVSSLDTFSTTASTSYVNLDTGPTVTLPLAGDYDLAHGCGWMDNSATGYATATLSIGGSAVTALEITMYGNAGNDGASGAIHRRRTALAVSTVLRQQYKASAGTARFDRRWLTALPVRVG